MATADLSPSTAARLRTLRVRMTALIALLATIAVTVFAVVVIRLDRQLRDEQIDTELLRISDNATRQLSFEDGAIQPEEPSIVDTVVALNPSFSVEEFQAQQERFGFPDPSADEILEYQRIAFDDAEEDVQIDLLVFALEENELDVVAAEADLGELLDEGVTTLAATTADDGPGTELVLEDVIELLLANPPDELFDEAYRRYVEVRADEAGVELDFETAFFSGANVSLGDDRLFDLNDEVTENASQALRQTVATDDGQRRDLRAAALRDGPEVRGTVIAVLDPTEFDDAHADLRNQVILLALVIVAASVIAAWFVAARTIRPTSRALAQQERFLADAAHELRTPIAAIRLTAESARPDTAVVNLERVAELAADASTLTDDLLTLARMDADRMELQREKVRLDLLVESTIAAIPGAIDAVEVRAAPTVTEADPRLLERAIGNLVRNAIAHGAASATTPGVVVIESTGTDHVVTVTDHGPGIDPETAADLFERFRSRTGSTGHGLGLPLARWIAQAHDGDLTVETPPDGGARFRLRLPR